MARKTMGINTVRNTRRNSRKHYSEERKIRIVLEGFRDEKTIAQLYWRVGTSVRV